MLENDPVSPLILRAKSRAQGTLHQDGIDSLVSGVRWTVAGLILLVGTLSSLSFLQGHSRVSKGVVIAFAVAALLDVFKGDWLVDSLRRKFTYPRIGYVSVEEPQVSFKNAPFYARPLIWLSALANGMWFWVLLFNLWWGLLLIVFGSALFQSFKSDVNRWPRHLLLLATFIFCVIYASSPIGLLGGCAAVAFIYLGDGILTLRRFLRSAPDVVTTQP
jgi:hypothetical protein